MLPNCTVHLLSHSIPHIFLLQTAQLIAVWYIDFTKNTGFFPFSVLAEVVGTIMLEITEALTEIQIMEIPIMEAKITEIPIMEIQTMATESKSPKCTVWKFEDFLSFKFYVKPILDNLEVVKLPFLPM